MNDQFLLLKDLSARLPYRVIVDIKYNKEHGSSDRLIICNEGSLMLNTDLIGLCIEKEIHLKPYLRSMSNMTEEERNEYYETMDKYTHRIYPNSADFSEHTEYSWTTETFDFLNAHHFDYRGLIPMGLALEAPKDMYRI